jgi:hypothetical protein
MMDTCTKVTVAISICAVLVALIIIICGLVQVLKRGNTISSQSAMKMYDLLAQVVDKDVRTLRTIMLDVHDMISFQPPPLDRVHVLETVVDEHVIIGLATNSSISQATRIENGVATGMTNLDDDDRNVLYARHHTDNLGYVLTTARLHFSGIFALRMSTGMYACCVYDSMYNLVVIRLKLNSYDHSVYTLTHQDNSILRYKGVRVDEGTFAVGLIRESGLYILNIFDFNHSIDIGPESSMELPAENNDKEPTPPSPKLLVEEEVSEEFLEEGSEDFLEEDSYILI